MWTVNLNSIILALIAAGGTSISVRFGRKQHEIHLLVNSNMTALREQLRSMTAQRDAARDATPPASAGGP